MKELEQKKLIVECMVGLQKLVPVMWEGYSITDNQYNVHGFITYNYKRDFVLLTFNFVSNEMNVSYVTSSIIYSKKIAEYLHGSVENQVEENPIIDLYRPVIANMIRETNKIYGVDLTEPYKNKHSGKGRQLIAYRLSDYFKLSLKEIGSILNIKYSSSCHALVTKGIKNFKTKHNHGYSKKI